MSSVWMILEPPSGRSHVLAAMFVFAPLTELGRGSIFSRQRLHLRLLLHRVQHHGLDRPRLRVSRPVGESAAIAEHFLFC